MFLFRAMKEWAMFCIMSVFVLLTGSHPFGEGIGLEVLFCDFGKYVRLDNPLFSVLEGAKGVQQ